MKKYFKKPNLLNNCFLNLVQNGTTRSTRKKKIIIKLLY